jgi:hypothetical protein
MSKIYSSDVEISLRLMAILQFFTEEAVSIDRLVSYDFLILHGNDVFGQLQSLHPKTPNSSTEFLIKRELFKRGLHLLISKELISVVIDKIGIRYKGTLLTSKFCQRLNSAYSKKLYFTVRSVIEAASAFSDSDLEGKIKIRLLTQDSLFKSEAVFLNYANG